MSDNKIETVDTFTNLPSLESLNLNHNRIKKIRPRSLPESLKFLDLGNNKLESVDPKTFENLPQLTTVDLKNNEIRSLPENLFENNLLLEKVLLGANKIRQLSPKVFENLPNLSEVDLEENECVLGVYGPKSFRAMKIEIARNCQPSEQNAHPDESRLKEYYHISPNNDKDRDDDRQARVVSKAENRKFRILIRKSLQDPFEKVEIHSHSSPDRAHSEASCENLRNQLMTCKREKAIAVKSEPKKFVNLKKENEKLRFLLKVSFDF